MSISALTSEELEVVHRAMLATFKFFTFDFHTRLGLEPEEMKALLETWPAIEDSNDDSIACCAVNNALNDLLHGIGIKNEKCRLLLGVDREEVERIYKKWALARGWQSTGGC